MTKNRFIIGRIALILAALPFVLSAYETGPDPFRTGPPEIPEPVWEVAAIPAR